MTDYTEVNDVGTGNLLLCHSTFYFCQRRNITTDVLFILNGYSYNTQGIMICSSAVYMLYGTIWITAQEPLSVECRFSENEEGTAFGFFSQSSRLRY